MLGNKTKKHRQRRAVSDTTPALLTPEQTKEARLVEGRDPDALDREKWRTEGRTLPALRSLMAAFTGRSKLDVRENGADGLALTIACPFEYEVGGNSLRPGVVA
jgi:hypothetical protein